METWNFQHQKHNMNNIKNLTTTLEKYLQPMGIPRPRDQEQYQLKHYQEEQTNNRTRNTDGKYKNHCMDTYGTSARKLI